MADIGQNYFLADVNWYYFQQCLLMMFFTWHRSMLFFRWHWLWFSRPTLVRAIFWVVMCKVFSTDVNWWCFSADIGWCYFWIILARVFFFSRIWYLAYVSESFLANIDWWWFSTDIGWGYFWSMLVTVLFWSMSSEAIFLPTSARVFGRHRWWLFFYLHLLGFWSTSIMTIFFVDID